jgi:hypothetical protein
MPSKSKPHFVPHLKLGRPDTGAEPSHQLFGVAHTAVRQIMKQMIQYPTAKATPASMRCSDKTALSIS